MILKAFLVAMVYYIAFWIERGAGVLQFSRPIVVAPLVGLVLGDVGTGILLGATFEAVFLGVMPIGGASPANPTVGAIIGTTMAILTGADANTALSIAVPVALLGVALQSINRIIMGLMVPIVDKCAEEGNIKGYVRWHFIMSFIQPLFITIIIFIAVAFGTDLIEPLVKNIPQFLTNGLKAAAGMMPAVGFAVLINMLYNKELFALYFLGFVLAIYLNLPSMAIAIIAFVMAVMEYFRSGENKGGGSSDTAKDLKFDNEMEDFLNA